MSPVAEAPDQSRRTAVEVALFVAVAAVLGFRLWTSFCFFPFAEWNDVRLAPSFMLWHGFNPYPGSETGPLTTWTYGPVPLLLNLPAVFASDAAGALLIAGVLNLLVAVVPIALVVWAIPAPLAAATRFTRGWALVLCLAVWPGASLQYIQSDNAAVAFGLLSVFFLGSRSPSAAMLAGLTAALAVWSKQTALALIPAQLLWLALAHDRSAAIRHAAICAAAGSALGAGFIVQFGWDGLWLNLVHLPGQFPYSQDFVGRTETLWQALALNVALPLACVVAARRMIFRRDSPWLLPVLMWLFLLPGSLASIYKVGGAANSLNGALHLLPTAALTAVGWLRWATPRTAAAWMAAIALGVLLHQLSAAPLLPVRPLTAHLASGAVLADRFAGQIYFPWNPLLTFYREHRFYHAEDGLSTRRAASHVRTPELTRRDLPASWTITAVPGWRENGAYRELQPTDAQLGALERWSLFFWPPGREFK